MTRRQRTGRQGEDLAAAYLAERGYRLLARNWRCAHGELDLIMAQGETLVFVEVKARRGQRFGRAEESLTAAKQAHLVAAAQAYLQESPGDWAAWRIDVVAIHWRGGRAEINHLENAVGW